MPTDTFTMFNPKPQNKMAKTKITRRRWTAQEHAFIALNKDNFSNEELAYILQRTPIAIYERRKVMGIGLGNLPQSAAVKPSRDWQSPLSSPVPSKKKVKLKKSFLWGLFSISEVVD